MPRQRAAFICQACGARAPRWMGRCPTCGEWNGLVAAVDAPPPVQLEAVPVDRLPAGEGQRLQSGCREFDRVLGGGIVAGTLVLLGGDPGVGKSTLLLQIAGRVAAQGGRVLYASGEESAHQLRGRAERLGALSPRLLVAPETDVGAITAEAERHDLRLLIVDSVQTARTADCPLPPGSPVQVREVALRLLEFAKGGGVPVVLVGHVTKAGALAGPRLLEHTVDVVLQFEGERYSSYRLLRAHKNRFGSVQELGVFEMGGAGLDEVANPSAEFLAERAAGVPGSVVTVTLEGSRPILCEVQALLAPPAFGAPRRTAAGIDVPRLAVLLAVLERPAVQPELPLIQGDADPLRAELGRVPQQLIEHGPEPLLLEEQRTVVMRAAAAIAARGGPAHGGSLDHHHLDAFPGEPPTGTQPGHTATDDDDRGSPAVTCAHSPVTGSSVPHSAMPPSGPMRQNGIHCEAMPNQLSQCVPSAGDSGIAASASSRCGRTGAR